MHPGSRSKLDWLWWDEYYRMKGAEKKWRRETGGAGETPDLDDGVLHFDQCY